MADDRLSSSFRDPSGFVFRRDGRLLRQVNRSYEASYALAESTGLFAKLHDEGLLVRHRRVDEAPAEPALAAFVIEPEPLRWITEPYEWCPSQLREAGLLTLRLQREALARGMTLRDASAFNVQFRGGRAVFLDTLSFGPWTEGAPWAAYAQFCRHFLAPLALAARVDPHLVASFRVHLDGFPLELASALLPVSSRLSPALLAHLHLHARARRKAAASPTAPPPQVSGARFSRAAMLGLVESLEGALHALRFEPGKGEWGDYYDRTSYLDQAMAHKEAVVAAMATAIRPSSAVDLGANRGRFSRILAGLDADVLAPDIDPETVEHAWRDLGAAGETRVLPMVQDLANPSPALGWASAEREPFLERAKSDLVLALAVVHHLALTSNVPLPDVARVFRRLAPAAIVEFVPREDPQVRRMLAGREDVFPDYTADGFERAFETAYRIEERVPLRESGRVLYRMAAR
jgi:SAM-dependent methyltransferase